MTIVDGNYLRLSGEEYLDENEAELTKELSPPERRRGVTWAGALGWNGIISA